MQIYKEKRLSYTLVVYDITELLPPKHGKNTHNEILSTQALSWNEFKCKQDELEKHSRGLWKSSEDSEETECQEF